MQFNGQISGNVFTAAIGDRITFADHSNFRTLLDQVNKAKVQKCVFDLSRLAAVDSAGLGMFMIALNEGKKHGWTLTIKAPQGQVFKLMELAKFDKLLTIER